MRKKLGKAAFHGVGSGEEVIQQGRINGYPSGVRGEGQIGGQRPQTPQKKLSVTNGQTDRWMDGQTDQQTIKVG